jgi:hypothetical protein
MMMSGGRFCPSHANNSAPAWVNFTNVPDRSRSSQPLAIAQSSPALIFRWRRLEFEQHRTVDQFDVDPTVLDGQAQRPSLAAQAMSGIVELIENITGQINLLVLNATIESARAGEAGFAVLASEVKNLANQVKQATDKITGEIDSLNTISRGVVGALEAIKREIQNVSEYVTATAAAVEEQSTVTSEMSSSMQRAAAEAASINQ